MSSRRVVITGLGVVAPNALGASDFWDALIRGDRACNEISAFDAANFPCRVGGELRDFSARKFVPKTYRKAVKVMARDIEIAVAAADLAFRDSGIITKGIDPDAVSVDPTRLACNIGAGLICSDLNELAAAVNTAVVDGKFDMRAWGSSGINNLTPLWLLKYLPNMLSCHVTIIHDARGPSNTITCGDASGHLAIGEAARLIARGGADVAIAGGAESKLNPMGLLRQQLLNRLNTNSNETPATACRPFDAAHDGTVMGEGGGLIVLEELSRAQARGAKIYAEIAGFGAACDPQGLQVTAPTNGGLGNAAKRAMRDANIGESNVGAIIAHGTGVTGEDERECAAWCSAVGQRGNVPAAAVTGAIGSLFAGAGAVETAVAALAIYHQTIPPTVNFSSLADGCKLDFTSAPRQAKMEYALTGSFTVGGQSGAIVLKRFE